jgi:integrase
VDLPPPLAEHVESVVGLVAPRYVLPLLILDECEPRVSELEAAVVGDIDEERKAIRVRPDAEKNQRYRYLHLPDDLFAALVGTPPPSEDRDAAERLFPGVTDATCAWQSPAHAGSVVSRTSRHTGCDADADRSTTSALAPGPRSRNCSVTQSASRPITTSTRSSTIAK